MNAATVSLLFLVMFMLQISHGQAASLHRSPHRPGEKNVVHKRKKAHLLASPHVSQKRHTKLMDAYQQWKGVRYRLGGTSHAAIDCSALIRHIYDKQFLRRLPRTTSGQIHKGRRISQDQLTPGDLVFFNTGRGQKHVGLYIGGQQFIHASRRKGVTLSKLDDKYWQRHYLTARRILPPPVS